MVSGCRRFYFVQPGDGCWQISFDARIDLSYVLLFPLPAKDVLLTRDQRLLPLEPGSRAGLLRHVGQRVRVRRHRRAGGDVLRHAAAADVIRA